MSSKNILAETTEKSLPTIWVSHGPIRLIHKIKHSEKFINNDIFVLFNTYLCCASRISVIYWPILWQTLKMLVWMEYYNLQTTSESTMSKMRKLRSREVKQLVQSLTSNWKMKKKKKSKERFSESRCRLFLQAAFLATVHSPNICGD